jgi:hypothetical protein
MKALSIRQPWAWGDRCGLEANRESHVADPLPRPASHPRWSARRSCWLRSPPIIRHRMSRGPTKRRRDRPGRTDRHHHRSSVEVGAARLFPLDPYRPDPNAVAAASRSARLVRGLTYAQAAETRRRSYGWSSFWTARISALGASSSMPLLLSPKFCWLLRRYRLSGLGFWGVRSGWLVTTFRRVCSRRVVVRGPGSGWVRRVCRTSRWSRAGGSCCG